MKPVLRIFTLLVGMTPSAAVFADFESYADLVEKLQLAVVNIQTTQIDRTATPSDPFKFFRSPRERGRQRQFQGSGSGFIISPDGYILTNRHVVNDSKNITVLFSNNRSFKGRLIGTDDSMDIALLKIDTQGLDFFPIGDSGIMRIGDPVLAMGYPLQLGFSVTTGIISGIGRNMRNGSVDLATYIQSDADITFGNSGGPLINSKGEVIGMNTMIVTSGETFGFAIPSNLFRNSVDQLKRFGKVRRGALGVQVGDLSPEALEYYHLDHGALVAGVTKGLPAQKAGLSRDDVILEINGAKVRDSSDVVAVISSKAPGEKVSLRYLSGGKVKHTEIKLGNRDDLFRENGAAAAEETGSDIYQGSGLGFSLIPLDEGARRELGLEKDLGGMVVKEVEPGGSADRNGLQPGTIVTHINREAISNAGDVARAIRESGKNDIIPVRLIEIARSWTGYTENERTIFLRKQ